MASHRTIPEAIVSAGDFAPYEDIPQPTDDARPPEPTRLTGGARPTCELRASILDPEPMPPITNEQREEMSRGLLEVTAEYQAERGAFTDEERATVRARFFSLG